MKSTTDKTIQDETLKKSVVVHMNVVKYFKNNKYLI